MKQYLHFFWASMLATAITPAFAQTADDPLVVTVGENIAPDGNCFFTFNATETGLLHVSLFLTSSDQVTEVDPDGNSTVIGMATDYSNGSDFYVKSGYTYNFGATVRGEQTFTVSVAPTQNAFLGNSCDAPMVLDREGGLLVPCYAPDYGTSTHFFEFTPEISGKLKLYADTSFRNLSVAEGCDTGWDYLNYEFDYSSSLGTYVYTLLVDEGQTYIFQAVGSSGSIVNCDLYEIISGASCEDPFYVSEGDVEIPAAAGTYYYQFTTPASPMYSAMKVFSDAEGSVVLSTSCAGYSQSYFDSLNFRKAPVPANSNYIIEYTKEAATDAPQWFTLLFEELSPIEDSEVGQNVEFGTQYTTPEGESTFYYSFSLPADSAPKFLTLASDATDSSYGGPFKLHARGANYPLFGQGANFKAEISAGVDYILEVIVPAGTSYSFSLEIEDMKPGQTANYPIEAVLGDNLLPDFSPAYLSYSQTYSAFVELSVDSADAKVSVSSVNEWGYPETVMVVTTEKGCKFEGIADKVYSIVVEDAAQGSVLDIRNLSYAQGETEETAFIIDLEEGESHTAILPNGPSKTWYKLEAPISGFFNLSTTMTQHYSSEVAVYVNDLSHKSTVGIDYQTYSYSDFKGSVIKGDTVIVCFNNTQIQVEPTATFSFSEAALGEASSNPIMVTYTEPSTKLTLPAIQGAGSVWYSIDLPDGVFNIVAKTSCTLKLYSAENPNKQIAENSWDYNTGEYNLIDFPLPGAGRYLLCLTSNYTEGNEVELFVKEPLPGQTAGTAYYYELTPGTGIALPEIKKPTWIKFDVNAGDLHILGIDGSYWNAYLYKESDLLNYEAMTTSYNIDGEYYYGIVDFQVDEPQTLYLCINSANEGSAIVFSGSAIEPEADPDFVTVSIQMTDGQKVSYMAPNHNYTTFGVTAPENWVVESVEIDGISFDVMPDYSVETHNRDINVEVALAYADEVVFVDSTTGVVAIDAKVNIAVSDGKVVISNVSVGDNIAVYTIGGLRMAGHAAQDTQVEFTLPAGTYIVTVNNSAAKVQL